MSGAGGPDKGASPLQVMRAVLWSFFGVRKGADYADDAARIRPAQVIVAGLLGAAVFVAALVVLVRLVTAK